MPAEQMNVEYFFRLLYNCLHGACYGSINMAEFSAWVAYLWTKIIIIGYILSVIGFFIIVYVTVRIFQLREREKIFYSTVIPVAGAENDENPRWKHIESLVNSAVASEWREAIIEADIMLDDALSRQGYAGDGVGEKLKSIEPSEFKSLENAWTAHKVRNQIAHEGSAFNLTQDFARRTVAHYENVFRELKAI